MQTDSTLRSLDSLASDTSPLDTSAKISPTSMSDSLRIRVGWELCSSTVRSQTSCVLLSVCQLLRQASPSSGGAVRRCNNLTKSTVCRGCGVFRPCLMPRQTKNSRLGKKASHPLDLIRKRHLGQEPELDSEVEEDEGREEETGPLLLN